MFRLLTTSLLLAASLALAQEGAPTLPPPPPVEGETKLVEPVQKPTPPLPTALEQRRGTVGVGYLGLAQMTPLSQFRSLGQGGLGSVVTTRSQVPLLGVRWWMRGGRIGLDLGLGAMLSTGDESIQFGSSPTLQIVGHLGLPIAVASTQHVIVLVAPEFRAGVSTLTSSGNGASTSLLELGVRGAVELFFGFIGVPQLSLEAALRVGVAREAYRFTVVSPLGQGNTGATGESFRFSTSLAGDAGSIIASTLSLKYYFGP